jgi:hypothetical protein
METFLISSYIDDELTLDEKIEFVEAVHGQARFKDEAVDLLHQEKWIRAEAVDRVPNVVFRDHRRRIHPFWRSAGLLAAGLAAAVWILFFGVPQQPEPTAASYRFVLYQPSVKKVEITGSFLEWSTRPMKKIGNSGYWEAVFEVPPGEHRLCYIVEGDKRIPDPTIPVREKDDFGGENSILTVKLET